ncbi:MAG TPA: hypothetical protein VGM80_18310, partial [Gaiellaceae bacterium]
LYPAPWRARYGEELDALILETNGGDRTPAKTYANVALSGARERMRASGLVGDGIPPNERMRAGSLLVLSAWAMFVAAGLGVAKFSEHWQVAVTPRGNLPAGAFHALLIGAAAGSGFVLAGIALALPSLVAFLRDGGWPGIRRRVLIAVTISLLSIAATIGLAGWAHGLTLGQRNGHDLGYSLAFLAWAFTALCSLAAWAVTAVATARRLALPTTVLRIEGWLSTGATVAMGAMTAATVSWWVALADSAPWALSGGRPGASGSAVPPQLVVEAALMLAATTLGALGSISARRGSASLG